MRTENTGFAIKRLLLITVISASVANVSAITVEPGPRSILLTKGASTSSFVFNDAVEAFDAINKSGLDNVTLYVAPSVYWLDDPDDESIRRSSTGTPYAVEVMCDTLSIIGLSDDPSHTVLAVNRGQTQGAIGNFTMLHFTGHSLTVENITLGNYCNVDLDYAPDPTLSKKRRRDAIVQAQLGLCSGTDRVYARNCRFISRLNLCPLTGARRSFYKDCYFECTDDALTGSGIYQDCKFTFYSGKPFYSTSATGAVFLNCDIHTRVHGTQYLTKMPGAVTLIDTRFTSDAPVILKWTRDSSPVRCYQSNVTLNDKPVFVDAERPQLSVDISSSQLLRAYKVTLNDGRVLYNTPNLLGGDDDWDPLYMRPEIAEAERLLGEKLLSLPVALKLNLSNRQLASQGDTTFVSPIFSLWGSYPIQSHSLLSQMSWNAPTTLSLLSSAGNLEAISNNQYPKDVAATISAVTPYGLVGASDVKILPYLKDAPTFVSRPVISNSKSALQLDYVLSDGAEDDSYIVWYRSTHPDRSDSVAVRHGHGITARTYPLTYADKGCYITASVSPRLSDTKTGAKVTINLDKTISQKMIGLFAAADNRLFTSFAEIPVRRGQPGRAGYWNFDTYKPVDTQEHDWTPDSSAGWYYGQGVDAATGLGLIQATRGARLSYTPMRNQCRNMTLEITAEPSKGPGQGFGSATGQYMDICVKFDAVTLTGYALRIERTPDYDKAVTFTLMRYDNGIVTPISESVASNCFRTPCHIKLDINDNTFVATARTDAEVVKTSSSDIKPYVMLSASVKPERNASVMIQHTGSAGTSATLLRNLDVKWK